MSPDEQRFCAWFEETFTIDQIKMESDLRGDLHLDTIALFELVQLLELMCDRALVSGSIDAMDTVADVYYTWLALRKTRTGSTVLPSAPDALSGPPS